VAGTEDGGSILTFYSFKGGVGRTMALANVAFLTALNGYRVLVMDWDLEAPGALYYFRGLMETTDVGVIKDTPGVLDIVWEWTADVEAAKRPNEVEKVLERYASGAAFERCVGRILAEDRLPRGGALDFIGAGAPEQAGGVPYADSLARFSWHEFFEERAGGIVLENLRRWAKANYDYVFLDSRTGFADVAGICTMQLPDTVALCFILNRQNMDGVASVARAIRGRRDEEVTLRAVPMRVAASDTSEEADARARGIHVLTRVGLFPQDAIQTDFRLLPVRAGANVPFYETLAPFAAPDPRLDVLVLNYLALGTHLLNRPLEMVDLDPAWVELVRRRLQPRQATIEYVMKLTSADPTRAISEIEGLIDNAFEAVSEERELTDDYVSALIDAMLVVLELSDDPLQGVHLLNSGLDLLRALATTHGGKWRDPLVRTIQRCLEEFSYFLEAEEELALLEELDGLIATGTAVVERLRRLGYRRRAARIYVQELNIEAAKQTIGEIRKLARDLAQQGSKLTGEQIDELRMAELDAAVLRGDVYQHEQLLDRAYNEYRGGLERLPPYAEAQARGDFQRLGFDLYDRLARAPAEHVEAALAASYAVEAARWGASHGGLVIRFTDLAAAVLRTKNPAPMAEAFCRFALGQDRRLQLQLSNYYGRQPGTAAAFLQSAADLVEAIRSGDLPAGPRTIELILQASEHVCRNIERRRQTYGESQRRIVAEPLERLLEAGQAAGAERESLAGLGNMLLTMARRRPPPPRPS